MADAFDQWSTGRPMFGARPQWVGEPHQSRIAAYQLYEQMYKNVPESFKLIQRGEDSKPIYIPSSRGIVDTMHRFLAPKLQFIPDPEVGSTSEQQAAAIIMRDLVRRERLYSMINAEKRFGLIRGDWLLHIVADADREEGSRISIKTLDPASYFPITEFDLDPELGDPDVIVGCHIVDQIEEGGKPAIYRTTYRKTTETGGPSPITVEEAVFEVDAWGGPDMSEKGIRAVRAPETLPEPINHLPVYHLQNSSQNTDWGTSELAGMERLIAAINQSISDEELELVLNGLGVYVTDAGTPFNPDTGEDEPWNLGPGRVVEITGGKTFERVTGTTTVAPHQEHLKYLHEQLDLGTGTPAIAKGIVDVQVAESGIALMLHMAPMLARGEEKELDITDVLTNFLFDLKAWFDAYEGTSIGEAVWIPQYGDKLPVNRKARVTEITSLYTAKIVSMKWVMAELKKLGIDVPDGQTMLNEIIEETLALATAQNDVDGARMDQELEQEKDDDATD